jgi:hypothetical protein
MYRLIKTMSGECVLKHNEDGSISAIPFAEANTDYQAYLAWVAQGNTAQPADTTGAA